MRDQIEFVANSPPRAFKLVSEDGEHKYPFVLEVQAENDDTIMKLSWAFNQFHVWLKLKIHFYFENAEPRICVPYFNTGMQSTVAIRVRLLTV